MFAKNDANLMERIGGSPVKQSAHCVFLKFASGGYLYPVYEACRKPRAKAIIYIDYGHPCRAGVKHSQ